MKFTIQRALERGTSKLSWLTSRFSFSFAHYHNPQRMGFGMLRVLNDDTVAPGKGFGAHAHSNMEIISVVLEGALVHQDSMGSEDITHAGEVQVMSAGKGVMHSEFNASQEQKVSFLQIWIVPHTMNSAPRYAKGVIPKERNVLHQLVSGFEGEAGIFIQQDARISFFRGDAGKQIVVNVTPGNGLFVFVIDGEIACGAYVLAQRDSAEITDTTHVTLSTKEESTVLVIEVPVS